MSTLTKTEKKALDELFLSLHVRKNLFQKTIFSLREIFFLLKKLLIRF
jgi:preprotein translocase subunit Sec63